MANIFTIVCFCIVVTVSGIPKERLDIEFENHSQRANFSKYPCENSQPRLFHLEEVSMEVWEEYKYTLKEIRPHVTVLHRCQNSGCCEFNKRCKPILEKKVELVYFHTLRDKYFSIEAINHKKCQCQDYILK
ncbi:uncharacterized protein LOC130441117 [Diorhabda sublineata]|uniref:uncharacterized protein LOC130441117 n=1 Tax=Diorhabda sublineata TaxID=1163346 RepID=UPI0024E0C769|nr:uncharacterized protein LOC130441117 [Diorhabda sublineata]